MGKSKLAQLKRAYFDIIADVLEALEQEACNKTKLASKSNLDTRASGRYILLLLRLGLVRRELSDNSINLTEKGRNFLEHYVKLKGFLELY